MRLFLVRRLAQTFVVVFGFTLILFSLLYIIPGDPVRLLTGDRDISPSIHAAIEHRLHLDQPIYIQYFYYLKNLLRGDLGESYLYHRPVADILKDYYPNSISLA